MKFLCEDMRAGWMVAIPFKERGATAPLRIKLPRISRRATTVRLRLIELES
jgi:hypothetical protein